MKKHKKLISDLFKKNTDIWTKQHGWVMSFRAFERSYKEYMKTVNRPLDAQRTGR